MLGTAGWFDRFSEKLGTYLLPHPVEQEQERLRTRTLVLLCLALIWTSQYFGGRLLEPGVWAVLAFAFAYGFSSLLMGLAYTRRRKINVGFIFVSLIIDPILLLAVLVVDPGTFAFLHPLLLFVVVRSGVRFGLEGLYTAWWATVAASPWLFYNEFWRSNLEFAFSFLLMLALLPVLFTSLVRRVHNARRIEEEQARFAAVHDTVLARNAFLAKVSHELRSPLQSIVSALDVFEMRHGNKTADDMELIGKMRRSSLLLNTHLKDLLTLAKGEAGRLEMRPETFEVCAMVEALANAAEDLAAAKSLEIVVDLPEAPVFVVADGSRIDQVLTNLVVNSIQYTEVGQVRIAFNGYEPTTRRLRFTVSDSGPGIPEAALPTLLAPDKLVTGAERRGEGSGLGLAIVRTLTDHLGGRIEVASQVGKGTTFSLEIPAERVEGEVSDTLPSDTTGRVLVVDDREDVLDAISSVVDELGFECDRASSAAIGANLLAARHYDAVLIDIDMPIKSGAALAAETRRGSGPNKETRFIGMSAADSFQNHGQLFDTCLSKPIDHAALRRALLGTGHLLSRPSQPGLWSDDGTGIGR